MQRQYFSHVYRANQLGDEQGEREEKKRKEKKNRQNKQDGRKIL